jgi:hypothetical protein
MRPSREQHTSVRRVGWILTATAATALTWPNAAVADAEAIAAATQQVAALEKQSALASQRAHVAYLDVQAGKAKLDELADDVEQARQQYDTARGVLDDIARQVYLNGGVEPRTLALVVGDAEDFLRSLDDLVSAGEAQNAAVTQAQIAAEQLLAAEAALRAEQSTLEESLDRLGQEKATARQALESARQYLQQLEEEERQRFAAEIAAAAAREAERQRAEVAAREAERQRAEAAAREAERQRAEAARATAIQQQRVISVQPPAPAPAPALTYADPGFAAAAAWASSPAAQAVIFCESSGNYFINTGNGYYGAWQFDYPSWHWNGGGRFAEYPHQASKAQQDFVAWTYYQRSGWRPWECAQKVL